jgi:hypothetical protein
MPMLNTTAVQKTIIPMNTKSVEGWYIIFQMLSVLFVMLTVGTGAGTIITGYIANRRQTKAIAEANTRADNASADVAKLQISVAEAERKRAEAERALLELQQRLMPRSITPEQTAKFIEFVKDAPKGKVKLTAVAAADNEPLKFAQILHGLLSNAGYSVEDKIGGFVSTGSPISGIVIKIRDAQAPPTHAAAIQKGLEYIGITTPGTTEAEVFNLNADTVIIYVYGKQ